MATSKTKKLGNFRVLRNLDGSLNASTLGCVQADEIRSLHQDVNNVLFGVKENPKTGDNTLCVYKRKNTTVELYIGEQLIDTLTPSIPLGFVTAKRKSQVYDLLIDLLQEDCLVHKSAKLSGSLDIAYVLRACCKAKLDYSLNQKVELDKHLWVEAFCEYFLVAEIRDLPNAANIIREFKVVPNVIKSILLELAGEASNLVNEEKEDDEETLEIATESNKSPLLLSARVVSSSEDTSDFDPIDEIVEVGSKVTLNDLKTEFHNVISVNNLLKICAKLSIPAKNGKSEINADQVALIRKHIIDNKMLEPVKVSTIL